MSAFPPICSLVSRFAVVGLGRNGLPAARALRGDGRRSGRRGTTHAAARAAADGVDAARSVRAAASRSMRLVLSPGIPHRAAAPHPVAARARASRRADPVGCRTAVSARCARAGSRARFAGITGTNGKSTTTALLAHILAAAGVPVAAGGNLGTAALALPLLPDDGVYVLEMSSYMLERIATVRFDAAAMLNLSADHLDRHGDMAGYAAAKRAIFDRQDGGRPGGGGRRRRAARATWRDWLRGAGAGGHGVRPSARGCLGDRGVLRDSTA